MWRIKELRVKEVVTLPQGYLLIGRVCRQLYKFLISGDTVLLEAEDGWILLPKRISKLINYKLLQFSIISSG